VKASQAEQDMHPTQILVMLRIVAAGPKEKSHQEPIVLRYSYTEWKENKQAKANTWWLKEAVIGNGWHLFHGVWPEA
jgi:hypothetical protein